MNYSIVTKYLTAAYCSKLKFSTCRKHENITLHLTTLQRLKQAKEVQ